MTAMVGKPRNQINMPRPDAYDLDTLQDVEQLAQRTGWRLELPGGEVVA
jgi:hypothetical protein